MPQKIAQIGVEVTHVVDHCPTAHCFEKLLDYEVPDEQIYGLLQASPSCTQTITLDCYLSPVKVCIKFMNWFRKKLEKASQEF